MTRGGTATKEDRVTPWKTTKQSGVRKSMEKT
jgi:hypothetical protein